MTSFHTTLYKSVEMVYVYTVENKDCPARCIFGEYTICTGTCAEPERKECSVVVRTLTSDILALNVRHLLTWEETCKAMVHPCAFPYGHHYCCEVHGWRCHKHDKRYWCKAYKQRIKGCLDASETAFNQKIVNERKREKWLRQQKEWLPKARKQFKQVKKLLNHHYPSAWTSQDTESPQVETSRSL